MEEKIEFFNCLDGFDYGDNDKLLDELQELVSQNP
jgi:hypothetical protein